VHAEAARAAGVATSTPNNWRTSDPVFDEAYSLAMSEAADALETEARRRAVEGVEEERFDKDGNVIVRRRLYSDSMLMFLLKGRKREVFGDKSQLELSNPDGSFKADNPTDAAARLAAILDDARRRRDAEPNDDPLFE
jgi:hypothetical protein